MKRKYRNLNRKYSHSDSDLKDTITVSDDLLDEKLIANILIYDFDFIKH